MILSNLFTRIFGLSQTIMTSAKIFLKKCFDEFGLYKIKSQIFPDNFRIKTLLKYSGFEHEATLPKETIRARKPQDIEIYSLYRKYYYGG